MILAACARGVVYAVLPAVIPGPIGILIDVSIGIHAFLA